MSTRRSGPDILLNTFGTFHWDKTPDHLVTTTTATATTTAATIIAMATDTTTFDPASILGMVGPIVVIAGMEDATIGMTMDAAEMVPTAIHVMEEEETDTATDEEEKEEEVGTIHTMKGSTAVVGLLPLITTMTTAAVITGDGIVTTGIVIPAVEDVHLAITTTGRDGIPAMVDHGVKVVSSKRTTGNVHTTPFMIPTGSNRPSELHPEKHCLVERVVSFVEDAVEAVIEKMVLSRPSLEKKRDLIGTALFL